MKKPVVIVGAVVLFGMIVTVIIPMWVATAGMSLPASGLGAVVFMIVGCFALGGGLMFLIFFSARRGYDDDAYLAAERGRPPQKDQ